MNILSIDLQAQFPTLPEVRSSVSFTGYIRDKAAFLGEDFRFPSAVKLTAYSPFSITPIP